MMRNPAAAMVCLAIGIAVAVPARAEPVSLGGVQFDMPPGWEQKTVDGGLLLSRDYPETEDAEQAGAMIQLLAVSAAPAALDANLAEMVSWLKETAGEDPMTESSGETLNGHPIRMEHRCCDHSNDVSVAQTVVGIAAPDQQILAGLLFINSSSDHEDAAEADFKALVRSIRFAGDDETGIDPRSGDGGLEGAFTHLDFGLMPNAFGGVDFQSESEVVLFDKAGLFAEALPAGDLAEHCATTPTDCGTYRLSGGGWFGGPETIEMRSMVNDYGVMETRILPLARAGNDLKIDEEDYIRLPPFDAGTRLDGSWTYIWASSGMTATSSGSVAVERNLVLHMDGRFSRTGWSGGSSSGDMGGVTASSDKPAEAGTYDITEYQLTLNGDDGSSQIFSVFAPDIGSDALLVIDGDNYLKDD